MAKKKEKKAEPISKPAKKTAAKLAGKNQGARKPAAVKVASKLAAKKTAKVTLKSVAKRVAALVSAKKPSPESGDETAASAAKKSASSPSHKKHVTTAAKSPAPKKPAPVLAQKKEVPPAKASVVKRAAVSSARKKPVVEKTPPEDADPAKPAVVEKVVKKESKKEKPPKIEKPEIREEIEVAGPDEGDEASDEIVLTDAEGRRYCRVKDCDQLAAVDGYCRYHYLLFWKKIQVRKKILTEGKLERYIEELTARYPDKFLDMLRKDLRSDKEFLTAIAELEIDESATESEFEDEAQNYIEEVRGMGEPAGRADEEDF